MKLIDVLKKEAVIPDLHSKSKPDVIKEFSQLLSSLYPNINEDRLFQVLMEREKQCSTAVDSGVAIPHGKLGGISSIIASLGRSLPGIDFESLDGNPSHLFILILAPENSSGAHLKLLARISKIFRVPEFRARLMDAKSQDEIYEIIAEEDAKH